MKAPIVLYSEKKKKQMSLRNIHRTQVIIKNTKTNVLSELILRKWSLHYVLRQNGLLRDDSVNWVVQYQCLNAVTMWHPLQIHNYTATVTSTALVVDNNATLKLIIMQHWRRRKSNSSTPDSMFYLQCFVTGICDHFSIYLLSPLSARQHHSTVVMMTSKVNGKTEIFMVM